MSDRHDPLDLFQRLPALEVGEDEVRRMQESVRALRRTARLESAVRPESSGERERTTTRTRGLWGALAAASLLAVLLLPSGADRHSGAEVQTALDHQLRETVAGLPLIEELATVASLYEIEAGDLDLVMIVGEDFDF